MEHLTEEVSSSLQLYNKYPQDILDHLRSIFRYKATIYNILELFDWIFYEIYISGGRWIEIPSKKVESFLGKNDHLIMKQLDCYITKNPSYSTDNHKCKEYCFTDAFIQSFVKCNDWREFVSYIKSLKVIAPFGSDCPLSSSISFGGESGERVSLNPILNPISSSIMLPPFVFQYIGEQEYEVSTYTIDYELLTKVSQEIFDRNHYNNDLEWVSAQHNAKTNLTNILTDNITQKRSNKTGRCYNAITQLQRELRKCLLKNTEKYVGELDLKCCHGFEILGKMCPHLSSQEYSLLFAALSRIDLWTHLGLECGIETKDAVKSKFQLFLNGRRNQNIGNPIYDYFYKNHQHFTELLFQVKKDKSYNLSNECSQIEASIMWSPQVQSYIKERAIKCDIIHDCLWLYGDVDDKTILDVAQYILRQFREIHDIEMVFTLEMLTKSKVIITAEDDNNLPSVSTSVILDNTMKETNDDADNIFGLTQEDIKKYNETLRRNDAEAVKKKSAVEVYPTTYTNPVSTYSHVRMFG